VRDQVEYAPWKTIGIALVHTALGDKDEKNFAFWRKLSSSAHLSLILLKVDPRFDSLRQDSRFPNLLRRR